MRQPIQSVTLSVRIRYDASAQLEALSESTGRTKSFLAAEAIEKYLASQSWQVEKIRAAVKKADSKDAKFVTHDKVTKWVENWDQENEEEMPT